MGRLWRVKWLQKYLYQGAEHFFLLLQGRWIFFDRVSQGCIGKLATGPHSSLLALASTIVCSSQVPFFSKKKKPPSFRILEGDLVHAYARARAHTHTHTPTYTTLPSHDAWGWPFMYTHKHTCNTFSGHTHTHTNTQNHTITHTKHTHTYTRTRTRTRTRTHAHTHTYRTIEDALTQTCT